MYRKIVTIAKVAVGNLLVLGLLSSCGNTANVEPVVGTVDTELIESETVVKSETTVEESEETTETNVVIENETALSEADKYPNYNGGHYEGELKETVESYITYEDIEPTVMYVINNTNGERYPTYHDPNVTDGELYESGLVDANQELQIDGKATYNGTDYYRLVFQEEMMLNHQIIIPADLVVAELQETPEVQQPEVQQPEVQQQPEQTPPPSENNTPEWDASTGISQDDWNAFFGGGNTTGQHNWQPNRGENFSVDENGNITGSGISQEDLEKSSDFVIH